MQEISQDIFIETSHSGTTLGAINAPHGLILIDAPLKLDDTRLWRSTLLNLGGGIDRLLINLDAHPDRTLGVRSMECTVVGHENMAQVFRNRPNTFKAQGSETGSEWEQVSNLGSIRWNPPEISFTESVNIYWGSKPILLETRSGPNSGSIWVVIPEDKIIFLGDLVVNNQPPFLSYAALDDWMDNLQLLLTPSYREFFFVGGRNGLVTYEDIRHQIIFLTEIKKRVEFLKNSSDPISEIESMLPALLGSFTFPYEKTNQYMQRLRWGLNHLYTRSFRTSIVEPEE
jgi:cyclase